MSSAALKAGFLLVGIAAGGGVAWLLQPHHAAPPRPLVSSFPAPPASQDTASPVLPPAAHRILPPAAAPDTSKQTRIEKWKKSFPGGPLPYALSGVGPKPGPPTQQIAGFTVTAQATDAPKPGEKPQLTTLLTATKASPPGKTISWELNQNGLSAEGDPETGGSVASTGFQTRGTGQEAGITQTPRTDGKHPKFLILHGLLRQAEDYEEPLTFQTPETTDRAGSKLQSQTTPSGVTVTLPPQGLLASGGKSGDNSVLRLSFQMQPTGPVELPQSPLFQKYHKPVLIRVGAMTPSGGSYEYPFSDPNPQGWMSIYNQPNQPWQYGPNPGVLNLLVQQRVYTREIPFALRVPVTHKPLSEFGRH